MPRISFQRVAVEIWADFLTGCWPAGMALAATNPGDVTISQADSEVSHDSTFEQLRGADRRTRSFASRPAGLLAQSGAGWIQGTIQDATGAAMPACVVHVVNQKTGVTNDTTSNEVGFYSVPGLFAGSYTIRSARPG